MTERKTPSANGARMTILEFAKILGVSKSTVSSAFTGKHGISAATQKTILQAAKEMGFEPNLYAQRLRSSASQDTIALCTADDLGVMTLTRWALRNALDAQGWKVDVHSPSQHSSHIDEEQSILIEQLRRLNPAAIIFNGNGLLPATEKQLHRYSEEGGVLISFDTATQLECDQANFDIFDSAYVAAKHLLDLGHHDIGLALHGENIKDVAGDLRFQGFTRALTEFGATTNLDWVWGEGCFEAGGANLGHKFLNLSHRPTAMIVINDATASSFVNVLLQNGLRVPDDVSVVSHDDVPAARYAIVPLSSVAYPTEKIVETVMELLQSRLDGSYTGPARKMVLTGELKIRQSTRSF